MPHVEDITESMLHFHRQPTVQLDWGVARVDAIDDQFREDLERIRSAELAAERSASTLRVF